ncbi:MAG: ATP-binding protein [Ramlibacter sp.]
MSQDFADSVFAHAAPRVRGVSSRRVALALLVLAVLPLLLLLLVAWGVQRRAVVERAEHDMAAWASLHVASQEQVLEATRQLLVAVSNTRSVIAADWPACNAYLQRLGGHFPHYVSIGVIALDGAVVCRSTQSTAAIQLGDRPYFKAVVNGAPYAMGDYLVGRVTGSKTVPFAHPVRDGQGVLLAVAFVGMDLNVLGQRLRAVPMPAGVSAAVADRTGAVLASTQPGGAASAAPGLDEGVTLAMAQGHSGSLRTMGADRRELMHHILPLAVGTGKLQLAVSAPVQILVRPLTQQLGVFMAGLLALLALYGVLIWRLGRLWLLRPLEQLGRSMRQIELGIYPGPDPASRSWVREIRVLQRGLTAMWTGLARRARQRDAALAASDAARAELQAVLNEMDDGFLVLDRGWSIKFCNRRAAALVLREPDDMDGCDFWSLFPGEGLRAARQACEREIGLGNPFACEEYHAHYQRWFEIRFFAAGDGIGVFLRDSTPHWEMIGELRERERRYRELFEANPNVMWIFDTRTLEFLAVNAAAVRRYGYTEAEFLAMRATEIGPMDDREQFAQSVQSVQRVGHASSLKDEPSIWRHVTKSGELMLVDIAHHAIAFEGRPARLVMATDVTSRLATESRLRRQLERLDATYGQAAAALQASRQIVSGYMRMLRADVLPALRRMQTLDAQTPAELERVRRKAGRVAHMLEEVLRLTEIGRAPFEPVLVDLGAVAAAQVKVLRRRDPQRVVHVEIEPGLQCRCDPALAPLLVHALLDNAWKFTANQPHAWIRMGREPARDGDSGVPAFFLSDNGVGFDAAEQERLYKPFARLHSGAEFPGDGLGLATARAVVARHGGEIHARSQPGQGATFIFTLEARPRPLGLQVSEVVIESLPPWED